MSKGETLVDTARNLEAMRIDMVVIRHGASGAAQFLGERIRSNVINAGDGTHEHPTQGLLDLLTLRDRFGRLDGLKVAICGDVLHSRVARSNIWGCTKLGAEVAVCGPRVAAAARIVRSWASPSFPASTTRSSGPTRSTCCGSSSSGWRAGFIPSLREYNRVFGVTSERLARAPKDLAHPASRADEPRRGDRQRRGRRPPQRDPPAGDQRRRRPHGGALLLAGGAPEWATARARGATSDEAAS